MIPYTKQWSSATPGYLIFLVDQSNSMSTAWDDGKSFADYTAEAINRTINELIATNAAGETVKDRVFVSLIGYGANNDEVKNIRSDYLSKYADSPITVQTINKKVSDGAGGWINMQVEMPIFLLPKFGGVTPMSGAFGLAKRLIQDWITEKNDNPVPVIINISDGKPYISNDIYESAESERTIKAAKEIMEIQTLDGNPLVFNVHISKGGQEIQFPENENELSGDDMAGLLFKISSKVPVVYKKAAKDLDLRNLKDNSRGFISNAAKPDTLIKFINFGSSGGINRTTA